jgi:hypothetical protein
MVAMPAHPNELGTPHFLSLPRGVSVRYCALRYRRSPNEPRRARAVGVSERGLRSIVRRARARKPEPLAVVGEALCYLSVRLPEIGRGVVKRGPTSVNSSATVVAAPGDI